MANNSEKRNGWVQRCLAAAFDGLAAWVLTHTVTSSPADSWMLFPYGGAAWDEIGAMHDAVWAEKAEEATGQ